MDNINGNPISEIDSAPLSNTDTAESTPLTIEQKYQQYLDKRKEYARKWRAANPDKVKKHNRERGVKARVGLTNVLEKLDLVMERLDLAKEERDVAIRSLEAMLLDCIADASRAVALIEHKLIPSITQ